MCLLCYFPPQAEVSPINLENACLTNPDGFGFSFLKSDNELTYFHTMNADQAIDLFISEREKHPDSHALFHARIATAGEVTVDNCHPFVIGGVSALLGHNGHLPIDLSKGEKRSDTKVFAQDLLPKWISSLDDPKRFKKLEKWASGNKLVILTNDQKLKKPVYLINESLGHWAEGVWYSNFSYEYFPKYYSKNNGYLFASELDSDYFGGEWYCPKCFGSLEYDEKNDSNFCGECYFCLDCYSECMNCLCYEPNQIWGGYDFMGA